MITGWVFGGEEVAVRLGSMPDHTRTALRDGISALTLRLLAKVKAEKLSDQVLRVRTGRLRRSITSRISEAGRVVTGTVGTNVEYAARHEFGKQGPEQVREHLRMVKQAWGKTLKQPHQVTVRAHTRNINYPARSFLRSTLEEMRPEISAELSAALNRAMK